MPPPALTHEGRFGALEGIQVQVELKLVDRYGIRIAPRHPLKSGDGPIHRIELGIDRVRYTPFAERFIGRGCCLSEDGRHGG